MKRQTKKRIEGRMGEKDQERNEQISEEVQLSSGAM